ncbi:methyltransferase type 11 [Janibacter hoylei PVAS-1]|uniref:Methyltransferase type 11 n=1 Tax=Janibacter hoylei PVAS-1 TaxID=1210046 RepID=K1DW20_9MICO|nr:methyltransferase type 11 [Janibacter hoylei PVAS-1]
MDEHEVEYTEAITRRESGQAETVSANRGWWDREASDYLTEHGSFLGDADLVWGPEGWSEDDLHVLGDPAELAGRRVLEFGGGGAQGARWCAARGATVVSTDLSGGMLATARLLDARTPRAGTRPRPGRRDAPPLRRRLLRRRLLRLRRDSLRRGLGGAHARARPGPATGRAARLLHLAPDPVGLPRRPRAGGADRQRLVLRRAAVRRGDVGRGELCRAPPHDGAPDRRDRRCGARAARRPRARVAGRQPRGVGWVVAAARRAPAGDGDLRRHATGVTGGQCPARM